MELRLTRFIFNDQCTIGQLEIDDRFECWTLEDVVRPAKIYAQTAIPTGRYQVAITRSQRFKRDLPLLLNVPNFAGIRIHAGNTAGHTEGCILVGQIKGQYSIARSRAAFNELFAKMKRAFDRKEPIQIRIIEKKPWQTPAIAEIQPVGDIEPTPTKEEL